MYRTRGREGMTLEQTVERRPIEARRMRTTVEPLMPASLDLEAKSRQRS